jgi:multidrug resistance efflux pump
MVLTGSDDYFVTGYFEETKLQRIHIGDKARVTLMGSRTPIYGTVVGFARGIEDQDDANADVNGKLPDVNPTFQWIRLAQRIPVRIELDPLPEQINLVAGQTVTVEVMNTIQK